MQDLDQAVDYMCRDTPMPSQHVARQILNAAETLAANPAQGQAGRINGTQEWVINGTPFIMAYRSRGDAFEVLRIVHAMQAWPERSGAG